MLFFDYVDDMVILPVDDMVIQNLGRFQPFSLGLPMISLRLHKQIASDPCVFTNAEAC